MNDIVSNRHILDIAGNVGCLKTDKRTARNAARVLLDNDVGAPIGDLKTIAMRVGAVFGVGSEDVMNGVLADGVTRSFNIDAVSVGPDWRVGPVRGKLQASADVISFY